MISSGLANAHLDYMAELCQDMSIGRPHMDVSTGKIEFPNGDFQYNAHISIPEIGYEHTHLTRAANDKEARDNTVVFTVNVLEKNRKAIAHKLLLSDRADVFVFCDEDSPLLREVARHWPNVLFCLFNVNEPASDKLPNNILESTGSDLAMATRLTTLSPDRKCVIMSDNPFAFTLSQVMDNFYWMSLDHLGNYVTALDKLLMKIIVCT